MDMGLAEATMTKCQNEIKRQSDYIDVRSAELATLEKQCYDRHMELKAIKEAAEEDLRIITLILKTAKEECDAQNAGGFLQVQACLNNDGRTYFKTDNSFV